MTHLSTSFFMTVVTWTTIIGGEGKHTKESIIHTVKIKTTQEVNNSSVTMNQTLNAAAINPRMIFKYAGQKHRRIQS